MRAVLAWLVAALLVVAGAAAPLSAQSLKLVPQSAGEGAFDAAAWTPDGRWLVEASGYEWIVRIWDPQTGFIVDSIRLPRSGKADQKMEIQALTVADGRRARMEALGPEPAGEGPRELLDFDIDLVARTARRVQPPRPASAPGARAAGDSGYIPDQGKLVLPDAPDGRTLKRVFGGVEVRRAGSEETQFLDFGETVQTDWASVSPDGTMVAFLSEKIVTEEPEAGMDPAAVRALEARNAEKAAAGPVVQLIVLNLVTGQAGPYGQTWDNYGDYSRLGWLGDGRVLLSEESSAYDRAKDARKTGEPAVGWVIDAVGERPLIEVSPRCYMQPLGPDRIVGAGLSHCRSRVKADRDIWVRGVEGEWSRLPVVLPRGATVDGLRASADGRLIALSLGHETLPTEVRILDGRTGATLHSMAMDEVLLTAFNFSTDDRTLVLVGQESVKVWRFSDKAPGEAPDVEELAAEAFDPSLVLMDGKDVLLGGFDSSALPRLVAGGGPEVAPLDVQSPLSGGFLKDKNILWVGTWDGVLKLFDRRDWSLIATVQRFHDEADGEYFLVHDPAGRYDSNMSPDYAPFRWLVADAPFQSLAPQTFMRQLYTPDLLQRLLACVPDRSCAKALPVAPDLARLNRALPEILSMEVRAGAKAGTVDVEVVAKEGRNELPSGAYGRATSGVHNLRLFRDGVLVGEVGVTQPGTDPADMAAWRAATRLLPRADGTIVTVFRGVPLPTGPLAEDMLFTAYAFNEDRVRGEEGEAEIPVALRPVLADALAKPRARRLFLLSIGVDAYPGGVFRPLRYAVADARAMAGLFSGAFVKEEDGGRPPMEIVPIRVEGTAGRPATRAQIHEAFLKLWQSTPDDIVVVSFSGHGYTDAKGRFFLVPSDVEAKGDMPVPSSMISADDLAGWLSPLEAGAIHMVIDACHSAASVMAGGFKPGPMGDPGLGQLAYDKGIRILSASAPDQHAMEDSARGAGLLTYALVVEGARQGKAVPKPEEGAAPTDVIGMDDLMAYAVRRLPQMEDVSDPAEGPGLVVEWSGPRVPRQTPKLFDFHPEFSPLAVRAGAGP
jgi:hypothetical protein